MAVIRGGDKLQKKLDQMAQDLGRGAQVDVGFFGEKTYPDGTSVALVAAFSEYGTAKNPPRPFMRNMVARNKKKWVPNIATALKIKDNDPVAALDLIGKEITEEIQDSIRSNTPPPNAPSTVAQKGFDRTLIDTSLLLNSPIHLVTPL